MDGNVTSLHGRPLFGEPDQEIIDRLEYLLSEARSGRLVGIAYAAMSGDRMMATNWVGTFVPTQMIGAVVVLQAELTADYMQQNPCK